MAFVAEWPSGLGKGLQSPVHGFDSRLRLFGFPRLQAARSMNRAAFCHLVPCYLVLVRRLGSPWRLVRRLGGPRPGQVKGCQLAVSQRLATDQ